MGDVQTPTAVLPLTTSNEPMTLDTTSQIHTPAAVNGTSSSSEEDNDPPLFSQSLISPEVAAILPEGYTIRPLRRSDFHNGKLPLASPTSTAQPKLCLPDTPLTTLPLRCVQASSTPSASSPSSAPPPLLPSTPATTSSPPATTPTTSS